MSVAKQLYQLQEIDLELEANEQSLNQIIAQLGESDVVVRARTKLVLEHQHLEELNQQQRSIEWEVDTLTSKLSPAEEELYSGRIHIPKELANLQHEIDGLKARRDQMEDKALGMMDQVELTTKSIAAINSELKVLEDEWQSQQRQLSADLEQLKTIASNLQDKRQRLAAEIDPQAIEVYQELKKQKRLAVAKVEQGICRGCRISLPVAELQQVRSGSPVRCSSCGRILLLA
jgi:predicted  nucleic acid-binding Zn-ribbon protein